MLIAKIQDGKVVDVADYTAMFPDTSFPDSGPTDEFMVENSCMYVNTYLPYDATTQCLEACDPYIQVDNPEHPLNWVYTVRVAQLTPEQIQAMHDTQAAQNQQKASELLYATDWATIPDVSDPAKSNPYLVNVDQFITYRNAIRAIAINPVSGFIDWPVKPDSLWSS